MSGGRSTALREARRALCDRLDLHGRLWCEAYSAAADDWLSRLFHQAVGEGSTGAALVAVGSYGRKRLAPSSDLDLLLLHAGRPGMEAVAEALWYPIWDQGIRLDHSVRTIRQSLEVAASDLPAAVGILQSRAIAGDFSLAQKLVEESHRMLSGRKRQWARQARDSMELRAERAGEVAYLLEPDLKEAHGGLRDLDLMGLAARLGTARPSARSKALLQGAEEILLAARVELHRPTTRSGDRLFLQEQDRIASALQYADADALMAKIAEAGRTVAWIADDVMRRAAPRRSEARGGPVTVAPGITKAGGEIVLEDSVRVDLLPELAFQLAEASARSGLPVSRPALARLAREIPEPPGGRWSPAMLDALVSLLGMGDLAIGPLEALDHVGLSVRLLPEWAMVRNKPQRNAYHRFTVDRHLVETAAAAAAHVRAVGRPDLLLIGALLHDIGKGLAGNHTTNGIALVAEMAPRMGFGPEDTESLVKMVRHHLLLADVATRRDLDDPATIEAVADAVGDAETLQLLAALTEADGMATGPSAWSPWKAGLVSELVARVEKALGGDEMLPSRPQLTERQKERVRRGAITLHLQGETLDVVAPDRPGLMAAVAGTLALHGINVRSASAVTSSNEKDMAVPMAVETLTIHMPFDKEIDLAAVRDDLERVLEGRLELHQKLGERARAYAGRRRRLAALPAEPRVLVHHGASRTATVVEVRAPDAVGVLYRITSALERCGLDVVSARVATLGHEVVDSFYLRDATGAKIQDEALLERAKREILASLEDDEGGESRS